MDSELALTDLSFDEKMARAAELKAKIAELEPAKRELDVLRAELDYDMQTMKSKRSEPVAGYYALVVETKSIVVNDEAALADWLETNPDVFDPDVYYVRKIDPKAVTALVEQTLQDTGEIVPGTEQVTTRRVDIRKAK